MNSRAVETCSLKSMVVFDRGLVSMNRRVHKREVVPHEGGLKTVRDSNEQEQDCKFKRRRRGRKQGEVIKALGEGRE